MNQKPPRNPVALEAAILTLRRAHNSAVEALLEAIIAEEDFCLSLLLNETTTNVMFHHQGAVCVVRNLRTRIQNAETAMDSYERRASEGRTAKHGDINP